MSNRSCSLLALIIAIVALSSCATEPAAPRPVTPLEQTPRLAVMSAFHEELTKLRSDATIVRTVAINGHIYYVGRLAGQPVVMTLSGKSMVNAAMTAQTLLDHFHITGIVFSGIAGGVNPALHVGDVTVPARWGEYQEQRFARKTATGWDTDDLIPEFGHFGMMFPKRVSVSRRGTPPNTVAKRFWFPVAPHMLNVAREAADGVRLARCTPAQACLKREPKVVVGGNGVSGPTFVDNAAYREWVWQTFQANALDMESAAVAHVAYSNAVPFIVFRSLSDLAGGGPGTNEIRVFFQLAANNSAAVVEAFLQHWRAP